MNKFYTVAHRLSQWADSTPDAVAQRYRKSGEWKTVTAREFCDRTFYLAVFLESKGFTKDDVGAIFSYNCPQWVQMDIAPTMLGAKSAGLYPNSNIKD
ncbi:MAG: AMP-binding protein, partial [Bdellovibrionota bacterium]